MACNWPRLCNSVPSQHLKAKPMDLSIAGWILISCGSEKLLRHVVHACSLNIVQWNWEMCCILVPTISKKNVSISSNSNVVSKYMMSAMFNVHWMNDAMLQCNKQTNVPTRCNNCPRRPCWLYIFYLVNVLSTAVITSRDIEDIAFKFSWTALAKIYDNNTSKTDVAPLCCKWVVGWMDGWMEISGWGYV